MADGRPGTGNTLRSVPSGLAMAGRSPRLEKEPTSRCDPSGDQRGTALPSTSMGTAATSDPVSVGSEDRAAVGVEGGSAVGAGRFGEG